MAGSKIISGCYLKATELLVICYSAIKNGYICTFYLVPNSCLILCPPTDCSPPGSFLHGILQARILEWIAISFSKGSSQTGKGNPFWSPSLAGGFFTIKTLGTLIHMYEVKWSEVAQSCLTLCDPIDCSLPGSSVHGIFQARVLEWGAIAFSRCSVPSINDHLLPCV